MSSVLITQNHKETPLKNNKKSLKSNKKSLKSNKKSLKNNRNIKLLAKCTDRLTKQKIEQSKINKLSSSLIEKISISINANDNLSTIIENLCNMFNINLVIEENIENKKIIYNAKEKPVFEIIKDICVAMGIKCKIKNNTVIICKDSLYIKHYSISFLSSKHQNKIETSTENSTVSDGKTANQSNFASKNIATTENDFWGEIKSCINFIISKTDNASVSVHPQSGLISVIGKYKDHKAVKKYIKKIQKLVTTQIYVDIKIIEILLYDEYSFGIEWNIFKGLLSDLLSSTSLGQGSQFFEMKEEKTSSFLSILKSLKKFGNVKVSSGLIFRLINNHVSRFESSDQQVHVQLKLKTTAKNDISVVDSDIKVIPVGLVLQLKACADIKTGKIILHISKKTTRQKGSMKDPATSLISKKQGGEEIKSEIPIVSTVAIDSTVILDENKTIIIGGLNEKTNESNNEDGLLPGKDRTRKIKNKEILLAVKAYIQ